MVSKHTHTRTHVRARQETINEALPYNHVYATTITCTTPIITSPAAAPCPTCAHLHRHQGDRGFGLRRRDQSQGVLQARAQGGEQSKLTRPQAAVAAVARRLRPRPAVRG